MADSPQSHASISQVLGGSRGSTLGGRSRRKRSPDATFVSGGLGPKTQPPTRPSSVPAYPPAV